MTAKTNKKPVFKKIIRFDVDKATKGVAHRITDNNGNEYPTFTTRFLDPFNKYLKVENERFEREHANDPQAKGKFATIYAFVHVCVIGWDDMQDEDGNPIPYDPELAYDYLVDEDNAWFRERLLERASDEAFYRPLTPNATKEADAGN